MKTFFSIVHLTINASLNERVSIGMIMSDGENFLFKISNQKLNILKPLISNQNYIFLKSYLKNLDCELNFNSAQKLELDVKKNLSKNWVNESYFSYLSRYSNNIISFSEPKSINSNLNDFDKLFHLYIYEKDDVHYFHREREIIVRARETLYPKIKHRVNIDATVNPSDFPELLTPVNVNFIGKNDVLVAGQTIDFNKSNYYLDNDINKFISFTKAADYNKKHKPGKYYLVGEEPPKKEVKNHSLWKAVSSSHLVDYVPINEVDKINEYMVQHDVSPYFVETE